MESQAGGGRAGADWVWPGYESVKARLGSLVIVTPAPSVSTQPRGFERKALSDMGCMAIRGGAGEVAEWSKALPC